MRAPLPAFAALLSVLLSAACAHKTSAELSAQTYDEPARQTYEPAMAPKNTESKTLGAGEKDPNEEPAPQPGAHGGGYVAAVCPLRCFYAQPGGSKDLAPEEEAKLKGAFGGTMDALRQCAANDTRFDGRRGPILNLRFTGSGDLADVGVDGTGFEGSADQCFHNVVRGGSMSYPQVKHTGPVTIRCHERCDPKPKGKGWVSPK